MRADAVMAQLVGSFDEGVYSKVAAEYARRHAYDRGVLVDISTSTKRLLGSALSDAIQHGRTYEEARAYIGEFFDDLEDWETYRIAATEIGMASRYGNLLTTQQLAADYDIEVERAYLSPASDACAEVCLPMAAYTEANVVSIAEAMSLSEQLHPHCRCDWVYDVADAEKALRRIIRRWSRCLVRC